MRETLLKKRTDMSMICQTGQQSRDFQAGGTQLTMACKSLLAEGFTNKSRMKNVKVSCTCRFNVKSPVFFQTFSCFENIKMLWKLRILSRQSLHATLYRKGLSKFVYESGRLKVRPNSSLKGFQNNTFYFVIWYAVHQLLSDEIVVNKYNHSVYLVKSGPGRC